MEKPYLSDVINYARDIEPYGFIQIYAGVGSGKNTFINNLVSGYTAKNDDGTEYTILPKTVLLITSRRAKVDETVNDKTVHVGSRILEWEKGCAVEEIDEYLNSERVIQATGDGEKSLIHQKSIACTNAAIEKYLQKKYVRSDPATHLWKRFDFIVLDEAHSVLADASYQGAPYYVHRLVNVAYHEYLKGNSECKIIVMTGSPKIISRFHMPSNGNHLDLMEKCRCVVPQYISFVDGIEAKKDFLRRLENGERIVYFANHVKTILSIYDSLSPEQQEITAVSFSKKERLEMNNPENKKILDRMKQTEEEIAKQQKLPENIKLLLTTSKNKEGINIKNKDIKAMYVESHAEVDIVQMAGRVREGIEGLYIITDASGFGSKESVWEGSFSRDKVSIDALDLSDDGIKQLNLVDFINHFFCQMCADNEIDLNKDNCWGKVCSFEKAVSFIEYIHDKFPYVRFDYFTNRFDEYHDRKSSLKYYQKQRKIWEDAKEDHEKLEALAKSWFNGITVVWPEDRKAQIDRYLEENGLIDVPYDNQARERIKSDVSRLLGRTVKQLNGTLMKYGYMETDCSKNRAASTYKMKKIIRI